MKFSQTFLSLFLTSALAAPAPSPEPALVKRNPGGINYSQNYNGNVANYSENLSTGHYTASWDSSTDFVVGLGWSTGAIRDISFSGNYNATKSASYLSVYGWLNTPQTEYYVVEAMGYSNPCSQMNVTQLGTFSSDGSEYTVCTDYRINEPSITGTSTFPQFFSVRKSQRMSGTVTTGNHFVYWAKHGGFGGKNGTKNLDFDFQVFATEAFGGYGSSSINVS